MSKNIFHLITGLSDGGAESVLYRLCTYDKTNRHVVVSLMDEGKYGPLLQEQGIEIHALNMPAGRVTFLGLFSLYKLIKRHDPDVVQTWMYHADLIGGVIARLSGVRSIFWNIRHTTLEPGKSRRSTIWVAKLCAHLSNLIPKRIVCCAHTACKLHSALGYDSTKMTVVENGYDLSFFCPNVDSGLQFRQELSISSTEVLLGMVGRFDAQKDHFGLLSALYLVKQSSLNFKFVLIGRYLNSDNTELVAKIRDLDLDENIYLLGQRSDIPSIMNGIDCHVLSSSFGEAFPNVVAEAMACGTPGIVTDVGDAALIVGATGWVIPAKNPQALADAIISSMNEYNQSSKLWKKRKLAARKLVEDNFSIDEMIKKYHAVWEIK